MVVLFKPNPMQIDLLSYKLDLAGVAYEVKRTELSNIWLVVDGVPLDYQAALVWVDERMQ
jgi:hypothetical protein